MKKILYIGTAAIALGVGVSSARAEDPVKLSLSGYISQWYGVIGQQSNKNTGQTNPSDAFQHGDAALAFAGSTKLDTGLTVGATIQLNGSPANQENNSYGQHQNNAVEFSYATISGAFGTVNGGTKYSVEHDMHQDAPEEGWLFVQDGIWQGNWVLAPTAGSRGFSTDWAGRTALYDELSTAQLQYISPTFMGFSLGLDYVPNDRSNSSDVGIQSTRPADGAANYGNGSSGHAVLAYTNTFGDLSVNADADYGHEEDGTQGAFVASPTPLTRKIALDGYSGGLSLGYKGFTLGGSILDRSPQHGSINGTSFNNLAGGGTVWDAGLGYENGPWGVSVSYLEGHAGDTANGPGTRIQTDKEQFYELGGHYTLGPGIRESLNVFHAAFKVTDGNPLDKNSGDGATLNTTINF